MGSPPETTLHDVPLDESLPYAITDAVSTRLVFDPLYQRLVEQGLERVYHIDMGAIPIAARMMRMGMAADRQRFNELSTDLGKRVGELDVEMYSIVGKEFDPDSPDQLAALLYDELKIHEGSGVRMKRTPKTGRFVVNDDILQALKHRHPVVQPLTERRELAKLKNSFADVLPLLIRSDGRIRTTLRVTRIASGRFCLAKGTLVEVVRDLSASPKGVPIEDVRAGDLAYSYDHAGKLVLRKILWAGKTGRQKVLRLHWLGTGRRRRGVLEITPNHEVRLVGGSYKKAADIVSADKLMALSRRDSLYGYSKLAPCGAGGKELNDQRFIFEQLNGYTPEHVHHKNHNKLDNRPNNLEGMGKSEHTSMHAKEGWTPERKASESARLHGIDPPPLKEWRENNDSPNALNLTRDWLESEMWRFKGKPRLLSKHHKIDHATLQKYMRLHDIEWLPIRRSFNVRGARITPEMVAEARRLNEEENETAATKFIGLGYRRWRELQAACGHEPFNHAITRVEIVDEEVDVYDLEVEETHCFIANEICVHNSSANPNLQQVPTRSEVAKLVRRCFVAPAGKLLCSMDLSGIEMVWAGELSGDEFLCKSLNEGRDVHSEGASLAFGKPPGRFEDGEWRYEIDKDTQRYPWKTAGFLILYGGTAMGLSDQLIAMGQRLIPAARAKIVSMKSAGKGSEKDYASLLRKAEEGATVLAGYNEKESQRLIDTWYGVHKGVYQWTQAVHSEARLYGYVTDYFGRKTWVPQVRSSVSRIREEGLRLAVNTLDQGAAASTLKIAMARVWRELQRMWSEGKDVECIMTIHDELIFEHPEGMEKEVEATFKPCFEEAVNIRVPVKSSASWAKDWAGLK